MTPPRARGRAAACLAACAAAAWLAGCGARKTGSGEEGDAATPAAAAAGAADATPAAAPASPGEAPAATSPGAAPAKAAPGPGPATATTGAPAAPGGPAGAPLPVAGGEPNRREVALFFQRADDDVLAPERRKILLTESVTDQARQIVSELIAGPHDDGLLPTIPRGTSVLGVFLDRHGTLYLDLSGELASLHPGGSDGELATIYSLVDSLTYNLPEVKRVRFLVGGEERDTLKDHIDLRRSFLKDMSLVRMDGGDSGGGR